MSEDRIVATPDTLAGKPRIRGTRISVELLLNQINVGWNDAMIIESYPHITREDIRAAQRYGVDHRWDSLDTPIHFVVDPAPEGGFVARGVSEAIFTEADDMASLRERARDAVRCHFDDADKRLKETSPIVALARKARESFPSVDSQQLREEFAAIRGEWDGRDSRK